MTAAASQVLDRVLVLEMVRVTEAAAIAASTLVGRGDEKAADAAAVEAMREALNSLYMDGTVVIGEGAVLSMGVYLGASTKIVDRETGEVFKGEVPPYSVVVPGSIGGGDGKPALYCAVIVKRVDAQTRSKTSINDLLRD